MPATHIATFKTHYHECDAVGYLKDIAYFHWMQEAAFAASAEVGYDFARYDQIGELWLVRESSIEHFSPLRYGDAIDITTWVMDFRRFRSLRAYEFRESHSEKLVARATTDWVYLDAKTLRPVTIPEAMQAAFFPEGAPESPLPRERYPKVHPEVGKAFTARYPIVWRNVDMMWHVNNAAYLHYLDDAEKSALAATGWMMPRLFERGLMLHTLQQRLVYHQPATLEDEVVVSTWCSDVQAETALRYYEIRRVQDDALLIQARKLWGVMDAKTGIPQPFPPDFGQHIDVGFSP